MIVNDIVIVGEQSADLKDYKFFCFDGVPQYVLVVQGRTSSEKNFDYFDMQWEHLPVHDKGTVNSPIIPSKPDSFEIMVELAKKLSEGIPHVRVDLYEIKNKPYFGELTFFDGSGFSIYEPKEYDTIFGDFLKLPSK